MLALWIHAAWAQQTEIVVEPATPASVDRAVFVSLPQPDGPSDPALAELVYGLLQNQINNTEGLLLTRLERAPPVFDMNAQLYLEACPPGQAVGCAYVVGNAAGADLAVATIVRKDGGSDVVDVVLVELDTAKELLTQTFTLETGERDAFAAGVAEVTAEVLLTDLGIELDLRAERDTAEPVEDVDAVAASLERLQQQTGGVLVVTQDTQRNVRAPDFTVDDLSRAMESDATKDWERLGMSPQEYFKYRNSGLSLDSWRAQTAGRQGQLLARLNLGMGRGPFDTQYDGRIAYEASSDGFAVVEAQAWQAALTGSGLRVGGSVGWGLTPSVEVGLQGGTTTGRTTLTVTTSTVDQTPSADRPEDFAHQVVYVGPRLVVSPLPRWPTRPYVGVDAVWMRGTPIDKVQQPPEELPSFDPITGLLVGATPGVEARLGPRLDGYAQVPLALLVAGGEPDRYTVGNDGLTTRTAPPAVNPLVTGIEVGVQVRFFGTVASRSKLR